MVISKRKAPTRKPKEITNRYIIKRLDKLDKRLDQHNALMNSVKRILNEVAKGLNEVEIERD